jgi:hypothetical protein
MTDKKIINAEHLAIKKKKVQTHKKRLAKKQR